MGRIGANCAHPLFYLRSEYTVKPEFFEKDSLGTGEGGKAVFSASTGKIMTAIYVDSDACPVKPEVVRVAKRYGFTVTFVSNSWMRLPEEWGAKMVVVEGQFDAADDRIVESILKNDIVVTADIPLAHRCIKAGARVIGPQGNIYTEDNIGSILATRDLLHVLRGAGEITGGPAPFRKEDRSKFLEGLDRVIQEIKRDESR